ncbi:uncharacterized protein LOC134155222 [Pezoporus occidentalis]|uniref:uncharacterized protein LOC134155222 n=1 Tax=Pezoporus occidentalis TaxID=407982 RepID=UPI002F91A209
MQTCVSITTLALRPLFTEKYRLPLAFRVKALGCKAQLWAGLESSSLCQCKVTNTFDLTTSSTQDWTGYPTGSGLGQVSQCQMEANMLRKDGDLSPAFSSTVSMGVIHPKQQISAGLTNLCSVPFLWGRIQCCAGRRRITGIKCYWHFKPQAGEEHLQSFTGNQPRLHGDRSCLQSHWLGQPFLQHQAQSINTPFSLLGLRHFSLLKPNLSLQSPSSAELTHRNDGSLEAVSRIFSSLFFFFSSLQICVVLVMIPKKRVVSRSTEQLCRHTGCSLALHSFSSHKHNKTEIEQQTTKGPHGFKT